MGEIAHVDLERLRTLADRVTAAAGEFAGMHCPGPPSDALPGSVVAVAAAPGPADERLRGVAAALGDWAAAARLSAQAFERADIAAGERFAPR